MKSLHKLVRRPLPEISTTTKAFRSKRDYSRTNNNLEIESYLLDSEQAESGKEVENGEEAG